MLTRPLGEPLRYPRKNRKEIFERVGVQLQASNYQNNIKVGEICQEISVLYKNPADYRELLQKFKLEQFEKAQVNKLSGGERQKLSVVLALIPKPEIVFLDELTTGLDTAARREVCNYKCGILSDVIFIGSNDSVRIVSGRFTESSFCVTVNTGN